MEYGRPETLKHLQEVASALGTVARPKNGNKINPVVGQTVPDQGVVIETRETGTKTCYKVEVSGDVVPTSIKLTNAISIPLPEGGVEFKGLEGNSVVVIPGLPVMFNRALRDNRSA